MRPLSQLPAAGVHAAADPDNVSGNGKTNTYLSIVFMIFMTILIFQLGMKATMTIYPFFIHAIFMSIFASVIGPFGGFFASGFKRAFKIKVSDRSRSYTRFGDSDLGMLPDFMLEFQL